MPPLRTYTFYNKINTDVIITFDIYGDESKAWRKLSNYVINVNDWKL